QALDILVNNAGIAYVEDQVKRNIEGMIQDVMTSGRTQPSAEATKTREDGQWRRTLAIHLDGTFYCTREALKIMEFNGSGNIINMGWIRSVTGILGAPDS